jgi:hypothetical protein
MTFRIVPNRIRSVSVGRVQQQRTSPPTLLRHDSACVLPALGVPPTNNEAEQWCSARATIVFDIFPESFIFNGAAQRD